MAKDPLPCTTSRQLFVDKFCVDQVDEDRKTRAILGLAGFLNKSQCLVVCWTPRYFSRLWTVYEIASWHDLKSSHKDVVFLPLAQTGMILSTMLVLTFFFYCRALVRILPSANFAALPQAFVVLVASCASLLSYNLQQHVKDINALPHQLANFSVGQAQSFCCSNNHIMPETGLPIRCDRKLVCQKLTERYLNKLDVSDRIKSSCVLAADSCLDNQREMSGEFEELRRSLSSKSISQLSKAADWQAAAINKFNRSVHNELASYVLKDFSRNGLRYHQLLYAGAPVLWYVCELIPAVSMSEQVDILVWLLIEQIAEVLLAFPAFFGLLYHGLLVLEKHPLEGPTGRVRATAFHLFVPAVILSLTGVSVKFLNGWVEHRLPFIMFSGCLVLVNLRLFSKLYCRSVAGAP